MKDVSAKWQRTVTGSWTPFYRATVTNEFQTGTSPEGTRLDLSDGKVTLDANADIFASAKMTLPGELFPEPFGDQTIAPYGPEVYIEAGIRYRDDLVETVGLGYFVIQDNDQRDAAIAGPIDVALQDRMSGIARAVLLAPVQFPADTTNGEFASALVTEVYPDVVIEWDDDVEHQPIGRDIIVEDDRLAPLKSMALGVGKLMRFDDRGALVFRTILNPLEAPVAARLYDGRGGTLIGVSRSLVRDGVVNAVVARGDGADEVGAAYGLAVDTDPHSVTRYNGRFGPAPIYITSSFIKTNDQAIIAADAELRRRKGLPFNLSFEVAPRFELEPDDLVQVQHRYGVGWHVISSLEIPLHPGSAMTGVTRQQLVQFRESL